MKAGTENRGQLVLLVLLIAVVVVLVASRGRSGRAPVTALSSADGAAERLLRQPDPALHLSYLAAVRSIRYEGDLRDLFELAPLAPATGPAVDPKGPGAASAAKRPVLPPPPPPIPLKFYGYATGPSEPKKVFLQLGEDIFVVTEGQIVASRYAIVRIDAGDVQIRDLETQRTESVPMSVN